MGGLGGFVIGAAWSLAGMVVSKMATQAVLGPKNTGWIGYGANIAAGFVLGAGVGMFYKGSAGARARNFIILGSVIGVIQRAIVDQTPFGKRLSLSGMGDYQVQGFLVPQRLADGLHSARIDYPSAIRPPAIPVAASNGMSGLIGSTSLR